jgi:hypothetical protein
MSSGLSKQRIKLSREISNTMVEVSIEHENNLRAGLETLLRLSRKIPIETARFNAESLWIKKEAKQVVSEHISERGEKIALSVLSSYPNEKENSDIAADCELTLDDVYNYLDRKRGDLHNWFKKGKSGWLFSIVGESMILTLVKRLMENQLNIKGGDNNNGTE